MPGLTADQIRYGVKHGLDVQPPPKPEQPGRWRCLLCPWPRWHTGTYTDWLRHYQEHHQDKEP
jgi:hypothetical protein